MTIKRPLKLLTGDPRTNRPIWIEHEEVTEATPNGRLDAFLVIDGTTKLPTQIDVSAAALGEWPADTELSAIIVFTRSMASPMSAVDPESSTPAPAEQEKLVEVSGGEVKVDGGVEQVDASVATSGATAEANLPEADVAAPTVSPPAAGGLAGDDPGEQHGVEQVVTSLEADKVGDAGPAPATP